MSLAEFINNSQLMLLVMYQNNQLSLPLSSAQVNGTILKFTHVINHHCLHFPNHNKYFEFTHIS